MVAWVPNLVDFGLRIQVDAGIEVELEHNVVVEAVGFILMPSIMDLLS